MFVCLTLFNGQFVLGLINPEGGNFYFQVLVSAIYKKSPAPGASFFCLGKWKIWLEIKHEFSLSLFEENEFLSTTRGLQRGGVTRGWMVGYRIKRKQSIVKLSPQIPNWLLSQKMDQIYPNLIHQKIYKTKRKQNVKYSSQRYFISYIWCLLGIFICFFVCSVLCFLHC